MLGHTLRFLLTAATRTSRRALVVLVAFLSAALIWAGLAGHGPTAARTVPPKPAIPIGLAADRLDSLRDLAAGGDERANLELSNALLDSFELYGRTDDLYEAMVWIDRRWDDAHRAELADRFARNYCDQRVARWHWLCMPGE